MHMLKKQPFWTVGKLKKKKKIVYNQVLVCMYVKFSERVTKCKYNAMKHLLFKYFRLLGCYFL